MAGQPPDEIRGRFPGQNEQVGGRLLLVLAGGRRGHPTRLTSNGCSTSCDARRALFNFLPICSGGRAPDDLLFDRAALQEYILVCCQSPDGGLLDKPGKPRDAYHTCYTISGLSVAQHFNNGGTCILGSRTNKLVSRVVRFVCTYTLRLLSAGRNQSRIQHTFGFS